MVLLVVLALTLNAQAQQRQLSLLPKPEKPNLAAPFAVAGFTFVLSSLFSVANNRSANDLSPAVAITGIVFSTGVLAFEIGEKKRDRLSRHIAAQH